MRHGSLFSGIGACELAAEWMGWENVFHCEWNEFGQKVLKYYWPNAISYGDITKTDFTVHRGTIDVLTGGFPCQPFSMAGKRKGADDDRYLWPEMLRAIKEVGPTWVIGENVAGIVSMVQPGNEVGVESQATLFEESNEETILEQEYVIETICSDLERIGYSVQPVLIPACAIGAPHRRDRVWFIAYNPNARTEGMQRRGENRVYEFRSTSNTANIDANRFRRNGDNWKCEHKKEWKEIWSELGNPRSKKPSTNPESEQGERMRLEQSEHSQSKQEQFRGGGGEDGSIGNASFSNNERLERIKVKGEIRGGWGKRDEQFTGFFRPDWENFPTQPPVRSGDDGLSSRLVRITVSKHRNESIKAYGNSMVPQVAYEIFKAIQESSILKPI